MVTGFLGRGERGRVGAGLGAIARGSCLAYRKEREREKEQASHHRDVDGSGLP